MMLRMIRRAARTASRPAPRRAPPRPRTARQRRSDAAGLRVATWMCMAILVVLIIFVAIHL